MQAIQTPAPTRILVVDDNAIDRDVFRRLLESHSARELQLVEQEQGRAALEEFQRQLPDCVILDLNLPDIDGLDLLKAFLREPHACPVIVTTAYGSEQIAVQAMKGGAADYIVKGSVTGDSLVHIVENALEKCALLRKVEQQRLAIEERTRELELALERERSARAAVEQSENRYRTLAEAMPQVVWTAAHPSGRFDYLNERWADLTGAAPARSLGRTWTEYLLPEDRALAAEAWQRSVQSLKPLELQCRLRAGDSSYRWQLVRALPLRENGSVVKWLGTFTDLEEEKRNEQLLHQRQKLESIGILAGGVAHDFNNLLVGIVGGVSYALDILPPNHELRSILEGAFKAGERAAHLTRQMLAYAGKGNYVVESVDLSQVLQATCELIQASIPKSVELKLLTRADLPRIHTDSSQLQQIIMNLIINAAEAIPVDRQGFVVVRTDSQRLEEPRLTGTALLPPGDYVVLDVRDNGSGIERGVLEKVFDPFFTTKFTGRGLGLAAVHGIVRTNNGGIEVETELGKGTTFRVFLPAPDPPAAAAPAQPARSTASPVVGRILIVDDEPIVCSTARSALQQAGHRVEVASSGQQAIDLLAASPGHFSLVLLDINMPGLNGEQTFEAIRHLYQNLPVIVCSGYSDSEVQARFAGKSVNGFLQKPFRSQAIREKVAEILAAK